MVRHVSPQDCRIYDSNPKNLRAHMGTVCASRSKPPGPVLKPAPLSSSIPIFAGSSLLFFFSLYVGLPFLLRKGVSWFSIYNFVLALPMFVLLAVALLAYKLESRTLTWAGAQDRFRLQRMDLCTWLWAASLSVFMYGGPIAIFISFGLAVIPLIMEKRTDYRGIWTGAGVLALFFFLSWSL